MKKVFVFGNVKCAELTDVAKTALNEIMGRNDVVLVGDDVGVDVLVQKYLKDHNYKNVVVYVSGKEVRNYIDVNGEWRINHVSVSDEDKKDEGLFYRAKDLEMIRDCDCAIAVWNGISRATERNINKLQCIEKKVRFIFDSTEML